MDNDATMDELDMMTWTVFDTRKAKNIIGESPWLAAALSWLIPGAGQFIAGARLRGIVFVVFLLASHVAQIAMFLSRSLSDTGALAFSVSIGVALAVFAPVDAFRVVRRRCSPVSERQAPLRATYFPVFLTVIMPGLGHLYLRRWSQGALMFLAYTLSRLALHANPYAFVVFAVFKALAALHLLRLYQRRASAPGHATVWLIAGLIAICQISLYPVALLQGHYFVQITRVQGNSMVPKLVGGSYIVVDRRVYRHSRPAAGDVVVFRAPTKRGADSNQACKRIVAVPGETVQLRDGIVFVDGKYRDVLGQLSRYVMKRAAKQTSNCSYGVGEPLSVPSGHYFVVGDNRINSLDSRCYGPISGDSIIGKVVRDYSVPHAIFE